MVSSQNSTLLLLSCFSRVRLCATPWTATHRLLCSWDSPGMNTGVDCHFLLHSQVLNPSEHITRKENNTPSWTQWENSKSNVSKKKKKKSSKTSKGLYIASMFGLSHICKAIFTLKKKAMWFYVLMEQRRKLIWLSQVILKNKFD